MTALRKGRVRPLRTFTRFPFLSLLPLAALVCPTPLLSQHWTLDSDVVLATRYEWRGLPLDPGLNTQYSLYGSVAWSDLTVTAGVWSLTDLSSEEGIGLPYRWASETSPWIEAAVGGPSRQFFGGLTAYTFRSPGAVVSLERRDTWEVYAGARGALPTVPFVGEAVLYWDPHRLAGGYGELAGALQIPFWTGLIAPVGSIFLETRTGLSLGQERRSDDTQSTDFLFEEAGFTHVDVSLRTTLLPVPVWSLRASLTLEGHWMKGFDPATKTMVAQAGERLDPTRWSWRVGLRLTAPRCRPERELCRDL